MSEIKEAVRSRYANIARQLEVLPADSTAGCCQLDGPDCGCGGSYAREDLQGIGLSEGVSLGCGNPTMLAELKPGAGDWIERRREPRLRQPDDARRA